MSATHASSHRDTGKRTLAQWFCLIFGATLLIAGLLGFVVNAAFNTGANVEGDNLILFEVNGIHNLVHIASGLVLLAAANTAPTARIAAIGFGVVYGLVTLIGFIDGDTVFGLIPVNTADNFLHLAITAAALAAGFMSPNRKSHSGRTIATDDRGADAGGNSARFDRTANGAGTGYAHGGQRDAASIASDERR